jgi:hypothetical protein
MQITIRLPAPPMTINGNNYEKTHYHSIQLQIKYIWLIKLDFQIFLNWLQHSWICNGGLVSPASGWMGWSISEAMQLSGRMWNSTPNSIFKSGAKHGCSQEPKRGKWLQLQGRIQDFWIGGGGGCNHWDTTHWYILQDHPS